MASIIIKRGTKQYDCTEDSPHITTASKRVVGVLSHVTAIYLSHMLTRRMSTHHPSENISKPGNFKKANLKKRKSIYSIRRHF